MPTTPIARIATAVGAGLAALALGAGPATAHVSPDRSEVPAGGFTAVGFTVGHGCDDSPTRQVAIQVPAGIDDVTPAIVPGWDVTVETEALAEPIEGSHGAPITERESVVTYTAQAGNELPDGFRQSFTLGFQAPDTPGETLRFNTIQTCVEGETAWIEADPEAEAPAPAVLVTEAEGGGHGGSDDVGDDDADATEVDTETADSATDDDDDGSSNGLAIAGLALGTLGFVTGGAALAKSRQGS